jgi:hypothetical protein
MHSVGMACGLFENPTTVHIHLIPTDRAAGNL